MCLTKNSTLIQAMIDADVDLNTQCNEGLTALMYATPDPEIVRQLILAGADETLQNKKGEDLERHIKRHDEYPDMPRVIDEALAERTQIELPTRQALKEELTKASDYLLDGPLQIKPLTRIFLEYATANLVVIAQRKADEAREIQKQRAAATRAAAVAWQAAQRARREAEAAAAAAQRPCIIQ